MRIDSGEILHRRALSLWGKSGGTDKATGANTYPNLLLQHLYDTLAVGELIWDRYFPAGLQDRLNSIAESRGREFFAFLCGIHDIGKATPLFQAKAPELAQRVREEGLDIPPEFAQSEIYPNKKWHHTRAGAHILRGDKPQSGFLVTDHGWTVPGVLWLASLVAGHHGVVPSDGVLNPKASAKRYHGKNDPAWLAV